MSDSEQMMQELIPGRNRKGVTSMQFSGHAKWLMISRLLHTHTHAHQCTLNSSFRLTEAECFPLRCHRKVKHFSLFQMSELNYDSRRSLPVLELMLAQRWSSWPPETHVFPLRRQGWSQGLPVVYGETLFTFWQWRTLRSFIACSWSGRDFLWAVWSPWRLPAGGASQTGVYAPTDGSILRSSTS